MSMPGLQGWQKGRPRKPDGGVRCSESSYSLQVDCEPTARSAMHFIVSMVAAQSYNR
jgi:hypothetical protein